MHQGFEELWIHHYIGTNFIVGEALTMWHPDVSISLHEWLNISDEPVFSSTRVNMVCCKSFIFYSELHTVEFFVTGLKKNSKYITSSAFLKGLKKSSSTERLKRTIFPLIIYP